MKLQICKMECAASSEETAIITSEDIIRHLMQNKEVYFKSQQIGEEDLSSIEKESIARSILNKNKSNFLSRFGKYLKLEHLAYFKRFLNESSDDNLINYHYNSLLRYHTKSAHAIDVRNRRYEALKQLIAEDTYFSEREMMKRNPLLYDQLIGKYLSEEERKARDSAGKKDVSFVNLLMEGIERDIAEDKKKEQTLVEENIMDEDSNSNDNHRNSLTINRINGPFAKIEWGKFEKKRNIADEQEEEEEDTDDETEVPRCEEMKAIEELKSPQMQSLETVPMETEPESSAGNSTTTKFIAFRISSKKLEKSKKPIPLATGHVTHREDIRTKVKKHQKLTEKCKKWGEYENVEEIRPWKRKETKIKIEDLTISIQERNMMKEEFISLMYQSFLDGKDDFDYSTVDFNEEYDNTEIVEQDAEEKYFESESPNEDDCQEKRSMECSSEDELDIFMERLNQHPTICQLSQDMKNL